jgi:hypothetical protein
LSATFRRDELMARGFEGFATVAELREERCRSLPHVPGVYVVVLPEEMDIRFRSASVGGWFKGRDPTVPLELLKGRRLRSGEVSYIGMAGTSLRTRVKALVDYGGGSPVGHQGGRLLWQVEDSDDMLIGWMQVLNAREVENGLLTAYETEFGELPFANLSH